MCFLIIVESYLMSSEDIFVLFDTQAQIHFDNKHFNNGYKIFLVPMERGITSRGI